jgi:hypothetical protein
MKKITSALKPGNADVIILATQPPESRKIFGDSAKTDRLIMVFQSGFEKFQKKHLRFWGLCVLVL